MSKESISDELLRKAVVRAIEMESSICKKKFDWEKEHSFSEKYVEQMKGLLTEMDETKDSSDEKIASYQVKKKSTRVKIFLIAAIVMLMGSVTVLAVEPLRGIVYRFIETIFPNHTYVYFEEMEEHINSENKDMDYDSYPRKLQMIPKGYQLFDETDLYDEAGLFQFIQLYENDQGDLFVYKQMAIDEIDLQSLGVTSDGTSAEEIAVCGEIAYLLTDERDYHTILYPRDSFLYMIGGYDDIEVLVECLESVFIEIDTKEDKIDSDSYPLKLEKVPEGYILHIEDDLYEESGVYDYMQIFHNEDEKSILYEQIDINELDLYSLVVSSDGTPAEEIAVCGEKAYVLTDEVQRNTVLYPRNDFLYLISGQEDVEILIQSLESIFKE